MNIDAPRGGVAPKPRESLGAVCFIREAHAHALAIYPRLGLVSVVPRTELTARGGSVYWKCETVGVMICDA